MANSSDAQDEVARWAALDRYLAGEGSAEDRAVVERWIAEDPEAARVARTLRQPVDPEALPTAEMFTQRVLAATDVATSRARRGKSYDRHGSARMGWSWPVAAATLVLCAGGGLASFWSRRPSQSPVPTRNYATNTGEQLNVMLIDGTRIVLAPRSTIRISQFDAQHRSVTLDGEAYFDVSSARGAPFIVYTGRTSTRVLGTAFSIRHYTANAPVRVDVISGKVVVAATSSRRPSLILTGGQRGDITDSSIVSAALPADEAAVSWRFGRLAFHDAPVQDVLATLSRWYGYEFHLTDPAIARRSLTVVLSTQSSAAAFSTLKLLLDVDFTFDGNQVTLSPHRGHQPMLRNREPLELVAPQAREVGR